MVNGPEDLSLTETDAVDWDSIVWAGPQREVERLRQRIFKATKEEDWPKVRNLQKLMLRSWSNTLISVRQVTQRNAGRKTAGIDGEVALTSEARADAAVHVHRTIGSWRNAAKLSRCWESFEFDGWRAGVGNADVAGAFDPVGVVAGAFDDAGAGPHPRFGVESVQHLGEGRR
jgi:hypothetical protein